MLTRAKEFVLNLLFPQRCPFCGEVVGFGGGCRCKEKLEEIQLPDTPLDLRRNGQMDDYLASVWACFAYTNPVSDTILRIKFEEDITPVADVANFMAAKFVACRLAQQFDFMVPVPVSARTMRTRRYNQSQLLAAHVADKTGFALQTGNLGKIKETDRQMDLGRKERMTNVQGAYSVAKPNLIAGKRVFWWTTLLPQGAR